MKNIFHSTILFIFLLTSSFIKAQVFNINVWNSQLCINTTAYAAVTATAPGAGSYSWTALGPGATQASVNSPSNGLSAMLTYTSCGVFTVQCFAYAAINPTQVVGNVSTTVAVLCSSATTPTIISSAFNASICSGNSATLSGLGGVTYTWIPNNLAGSSIVVSPTANTCYTLLTTNAVGCMGMSSSCMSVLPTYTISIGGNTAVCLGATASLSLSGGPSFSIVPGNMTSTNPVFSPSVTTNYTLTCPIGLYSCPTSSVITITVNNPPPVAIVGNYTNCSGSSTTLTASGGASSYTWSIGSTLNSVVVSPLSNTCYSLAGTSANGCTNMAVHCQTVLPSPTLSIAGNNTLCLGSGVNLTASGATTYTWNTSPAINTATLNVVPTTTTNYMVYGSGSNGCVGFNNLVITPNPSCAIVWPGDANRDGQVSNTDVLELGLAAGNTGPARTPTSNAWVGQYSSAWGGTISTGWNQCHADCNGDGVINANDNTAISSNFALTHSFKEMNNLSVNPDIQLIPSQSSVNTGAWGKADIILGDAANSISQLYGVAFDLNYDQTLIQTDSVKINYTTSFLNASNQNIDFGKAIFANGKLYAATVRVDHNNVSGNGKIGELWYKVKSTVPSNSVMHLSVSGSIKMSSTGTSSALSGGSASVAIVNAAVNLSENSLLENDLAFYPNPASQNLTLKSALKTSVNYNIKDLLGRVIFKGEFTQMRTVDVSELKTGTYFIEFYSEGQSSYKKLIIEK